MKKPSSAEKEKTNAYASLIRKSHGVMDDESTTLQEGTLKTTARRFNNGHKTFTIPEQDFLKEIYYSESAAHDRFVEKAPNLRKPRDPIKAEYTSRNEHEGERLISSASLRGTLCASARVIPENQRQPVPEHRALVADIEQVDALRRRKEMIEAELNLLDKVMVHKRMCLSMTNVGGNAPRNLHPAMEQTKFDKF